LSPESPTEVEVTLLLCDFAQSVGGKLYVMGGGWSQAPAAQPLNMGLAVKMAVPWDRANDPIRVQTELVTEDGQPVDLGEGPIQSQGEIELGRPPGLRRGTPLDATLAFNLSGISLTPGGYVWQFRVDDEVRARAPFRIISQG
jgi:hypothetical protein